MCSPRLLLLVAFGEFRKFPQPNPSSHFTAQGGLAIGGECYPHDTAEFADPLELFSGCDVPQLQLIGPAQKNPAPFWRERDAFHKQGTVAKLLEGLARRYIPHANCSPAP